MAIAVVRADRNTGTTSTTVTFGATPSAGYLLVAWVQATVASLGNLTATAGWGTAAGLEDSGNGFAGKIFWKKSNGTETSVTITATGAGACSASVFQVSGFTDPTTDKSATNDESGSGTTGQTGSTGTLSASAEFVAALVAVDSTTTLISWDSAFLGEQFSSSYGVGGYKITAATTALNPTATYSPTSNRVAMIATFMEQGPTPVPKDLALEWNVGAYVPKDLTLGWVVGGPLPKSLTLQWNLDGYVPPGWTTRTEIALTTDPLTRPADVDYTDISDVDCCVRSLSIKRGTKILSAGLETGTSTALVENSSRALDPTYTASPLAPDVLPRKRIRHVLETAAGDVTLHTGFIERFIPRWAQETAYVTIPTQDLFGIVAGATLPPSVLDVVTRGLDPTAPVTTPTAYWPMHEQVFTDTADDVMGTLDGTYVGPVQGGSQLTPFDARPSPQFAKPGTVNGDQIDCTAMVVTPVTIPDVFSFSCWFKWNVGGYDNVNPAVIILQDGSPPVTDPSYPTATPKQILLYLSQDSISGRHHINIRLQDGSNIAIVKYAVGVLLLDGKAHHLAFSVNGATKTVQTWCDGFGGTASDTGISSTVALSTLNVSSIISNLETIGVGWGIDWNNVSSTVADSAIVGEAVYWNNHVITSTEVNYIIAAGTVARDGDTTDERLDWICDQIGIDAADRDFDAGSQVCGPTTLASQNFLSYVRKIVATEAGACYVNGDGKIRFRARPSSPPVIQTFSDSPTADGGVPCAALDPEFSYARIINTLDVARENDAVQTITDDPSIATYGPLSGATGGKLDTLHQTADDARTTGAFLITGHADPTVYIPTVKVTSIDRGVSLGALTDVEIGDLVAVKARPPGATSETLAVEAQVEAVQYDFPNPREFTTTYSPGS